MKPSLPELRVFPIAYATMLVLFYVLHGKAYYLAPVYPVLLAGGAVAMESWFKWSPLRCAVIGLVSIVGALLAPLAVPICRARLRRLCACAGHSIRRRIDGNA